MFAKKHERSDIIYKVNITGTANIICQKANIIEKPSTKVDGFFMGWVMGFSPGLKKCPPDTFYPLQARVGLFESHPPTNAQIKKRVAEAATYQDR